MPNKTKNDLLKEIEELNSQLYSTEQDLIKFEQIAKCASVGEEYKIIYDSYMNAGFNKEEAFELLKVIVDKTANSFLHDIAFNRRSQYQRYRRY